MLTRHGFRVLPGCAVAGIAVQQLALRRFAASDLTWIFGLNGLD
jgi:hypothetical protein